MYLPKRINKLCLNLLLQDISSRLRGKYQSLRLHIYKSSLGSM